jgi:hypothetical protein
MKIFSIRRKKIHRYDINELILVSVYENKKDFMIIKFYNTLNIIYSKQK